MLRQDKEKSALPHKALFPIKPTGKKVDYTQHHNTTMLPFCQEMLLRTVGICF